MKSRLVASATLLTLAFAGCSGNAATPGTTAGTDTAGGEPSGDVTVWMYPVIADDAASQTFWADAESAFEADHPSIDLTIELQPWAGRDEQVATAIASNTGPDLVLLTPDSLPGFVDNGGLKSLADAQDPAFLESAVTAATVDGEIYAVPLYHTVIAPVYNQPLFEAAGITELPETWDDLTAAAPALAANGITLMDYSGVATLNMTYYPFLWQAGGSVFADDGESVAFNSDEGRAALQLLVDLKNANALPADAATKENTVEGSGLTNGTIAMTPMAVKADAVTLQTALGEDAVAVGAPLTGEEQVTFGLPGLLARTSISDDDGTAEVVARYLSSAEFQTSLSEASGYFPARTDATADSSDPLNEPFQAALQYARPGEVNPHSRQVMAALSAHIQAALQGTKTVEQALADAETECNAILQS
ncbi:extracellular solute-binding protein [Propioniciclava soli]|uniref:sugar ABC transporter substrate-binding protein n=1 Tax=Propioniciclava soli TaxID=2775081 RepID=UPI001E2E2212|nr:extracellular solute-binding protein [Propioniciclava soli]